MWSYLLILSGTVTGFPQETLFWSSLYNWHTVKYVGELHNKNVSYLHTGSSNSNNFFTTTKLHAHTLQNCDDFSTKDALLTWSVQLTNSKNSGTVQQKCVISLYWIVQSWQFFHHCKAPCSYSLKLWQTSPKDLLLEWPVQLAHSKICWRIAQQKCVISLHQIVQSWQFFHCSEVPCTYSPELQWLPTKDALLTWSVQLTNSKKQWNCATKMSHISILDHPILTIFSPLQSSMLILSGTVTTFPKGSVFGVVCTVGTQ